MEIRKGSIGDEDVARIYTGDGIVYPLPVQDGLILWYDFMGRRNSDANRGIAEDLSGNGNRGQMINFAYEAGSGYEDGLQFDGVDDFVATGISDLPSYGIIEIILKFPQNSELAEILSLHTHFVLRKTGNGILTFIDKRKNPDRFNAHEILKPSSNYSIVISFSPNENRIYINGRLDNSFQFPEGEIASIDSSLVIGRLSAGLGQLRGIIPSFKLYNRVLTPEEIAHNYAIEKERWNL